MTHTPNIDKLRVALANVQSLLDDPQPESSVWKWALGAHLDVLVDFRMGDGFVDWCHHNLELVDGKLPWMVTSET